MDPITFPTKGNLMLAKNALQLSLHGYDLLDRKRMVLIKEIMELKNKAQELQAIIAHIFEAAYTALQAAAITMGTDKITQLISGLPPENSIEIKIRSAMGVAIPKISYNNATKDSPPFGFENTTPALDEAYIKFNAAKDLTIQLAEVESAIYRLAISIKKTQKRANALKNITIPRYKALAKSIQQTLEERDRDAFARLKIIKTTHS